MSTTPSTSPVEIELMGVADVDPVERVVHYAAHVTHADCGYSGPGAAIDNSGRLDPDWVVVEHCPGCGEYIEGPVR